MEVGCFCTHRLGEGEKVLYSLAILKLTNLETIVLCIETEDVISLLEEEDLRAERRSQL